ncbi:hypothetical protein RclHR1_06260009 [Rhizophagus clarus]|uniref:Uncharacterized protein n=1 Tax=Rhizophagus clarus TaxID=94130 RepID=A0A2Z6RX90_9GLOM|nr:hypothetical protein RclHR1_06260009 [Rhizophagus clarus]
MSYFKKCGNIASCRIYSRKNAKVQQARIVYDSAHSIAHFDTQWAVYCFSTCLWVTSYHYTVDQKSSCHKFVATLTQLLPNTKNIDLALSPEIWVLRPCGKLGCAPNQCPSRQHRGRTRDRNPVAALKERFNINQPTQSKACSRSGSHSRSRSKGPDNSRSSQPCQPLANISNASTPRHDRSKSGDRYDRSVSFSTALHTPPSFSSRSHSSTMPPHEAANILSLLKALQQDMADVRNRITALELNDQHMARIEQHLGPPSSLLQLLLSLLLLLHLPPYYFFFIFLPITSSSSSSPSMVSSPDQTRDEIQAINAKHSAIENKLDMLANSISGFIRSITSSSSSSNAANNNFDYDFFVRNPPNLVDIDKFSLNDSLFSSHSSFSSSSPPPNSFNIFSFNINSLKMHLQNKIELLNNFFSLKQISFGSVVDTHLHPKQMHFLAKRLSTYTVFSSVLDTSLIWGYLFYPIYFNQPQIASKRIHRLFNFLLSSGYVDFTPINFSDSLGTFHHANFSSRIDYVWSCPLLKSFLLTLAIFDVRDLDFSDYNPVITFYDCSFLHFSIKLARTYQLKWRFHRIFLLDSITPSQWDDFSTHVDKLCNISPTLFASWHINRMYEYLHTNIITGANAILLACTIGNDHTPKLPKDLKILLQHYCFLNRVLHSIRLLRKYLHTFSSSHDHKWSIYLVRLNNIFRLYSSIFPTVPVLPLVLSSCWADNFNALFDTLSQSSKSLRGLHLLIEKEFQDSSIKTFIDSRDSNFDTDISSFINSALSRSRRRIVLDRVFINHPTTPRLLTNPKDISDAVVNHFQNAVPIKSAPPSHISALPDRWRSAYSPIDAVSFDIYDSLLSSPSLEEWLSTRQAIVCLIPKPHEWRCQLKNTRPITLLEVIQKSFVKLFYNRLSSILATHNVLTSGNFAGLPGGTCRNPIITLESIIHDAVCNSSPLWILSQDISKAFDSVNLTMLKFALERIRLPASAIMLLLSLFMHRFNWVYMAHGDTSSYQVRIGID